MLVVVNELCDNFSDHRRCRQSVHWRHDRRRPCRNPKACHARRKFRRDCASWELNRAALIWANTAPENCIFYISPMYEFSHSQGQQLTSRLSVQGGLISRTPCLLPSPVASDARRKSIIAFDAVMFLLPFMIAAENTQVFCRSLGRGPQSQYRPQAQSPRSDAHRSRRRIMANRRTEAINAALASSKPIDHRPCLELARASS